MKNIGLYFGTFNPIHIGHLIIANHMVENSKLDKIWMVVTPHNPFKNKKSLLNNYHRYEMVEMATKNYDKINPSNIEFKIPQPNYTIDTLTYINEKYPKDNFNLIMGEDNLQNFHKWKNFETILKNHEIFVYPRITKQKVNKTFINHTKINRINAPIIEISSTLIRKGIKEKKNIRPYLSESVYTFIDNMNFYKK